MKTLFNKPIIQDYINVSNIFTFRKGDGGYTSAEFGGLVEPFTTGPLNLLDGTTVIVTYSYHAKINPNIKNRPVGLGWHNCYSFRNGVESNRIRDTFNSVFIDKGPKVSTTLEEGYEKEHRKYGLIYSGLYNSSSGINNLNQFIQAEKITKDINPTYGSIQKLHAGWGQGGDLLALCEDRILKILANKDALYNADGDVNLTSTNNVLGATNPYSGEFGISKNPESFASEAYRAYFTDKVRGKVIRLSIDGLTPISDHGMKDWFKDNLKLANVLVGSYDDKKSEYNISLKGRDDNGNVSIAKTVSFKEDVRGWVSFKSFVPENGISCANDYYTFLNGKLWKHHDTSVNRNTFYNIFSNTSINIIANTSPSVVKSFNTINYEGSHSKVTFNAEDDQYYNIMGAKNGWYVDNIFTNKEKGNLNEFIEKEGKWFNYIKGNPIQHSLNINSGKIENILVNQDGSSSWDQASFAIQGLGILDGVASPFIIYGCTNASSTNYNPLATIDDGTCDAGILGCTEASAGAYGGYNVINTIEDGSCKFFGCTDVNAQNYQGFSAEINVYESNWPGSIVDNGTCLAGVPGCMLETMFNYNPTATYDPLPNNGSCMPIVYGCVGRVDPDTSSFIYAYNAINYAGPGNIIGMNANTDDGSCAWSFCADPGDANYNAAAETEAGWENNDYNTAYHTWAYSNASTNASLPNAPAVSVNSTDCEANLQVLYGCTDIAATNFQVPISGFTLQMCNGTVPGCDNTTGNMCTGPGNNECCSISTSPQVGACRDPLAVNYNSSSPYDCTGQIPLTNAAGQHPVYGNLSCCTYEGCMDILADNYNPQAVQQSTGGCANGGCCYSTEAYQCGADGLVDATTLSNLDNTDIVNNPQTYGFSATHNNAIPVGIWLDASQANALVPSDWSGITNNAPCVPGCMLQAACEYNNQATFDPISGNGSCLTFASGIVEYACIGGTCTSIGPCHPDYNNVTLFSTSSCGSGCTTSAGGALGTGGAGGPVNGCTDPTASNYNSQATNDPFVTSTNPFGQCQWIIFDSNVNINACRTLDSSVPADLTNITNIISSAAGAYSPYTGTTLTTPMCACCSANNFLTYNPTTQQTENCGTSSYNC